MDEKKSPQTAKIRPDLEGKSQAQGPSLPELGMAGPHSRHLMTGCAPPPSPGWISILHLPYTTWTQAEDKALEEMWKRHGQWTCPHLQCMVPPDRRLDTAASMGDPWGDLHDRSNLHAGFMPSLHWIQKVPDGVPVELAAGGARSPGPQTSI